MNLRPSGYEPDELPGCSIPRRLLVMIVREIFLVFTRFGGDLLSQGLSPSTIGATALNFRVRDGTGCFARAMTTKPSKYQKPPAFGICGRQDICEANARCRRPVMSRVVFQKRKVFRSTFCPSFVLLFGVYETVCYWNRSSLSGD